MFLCGAWVVSVEGGTLYQWKDRRGMVHVTDVPPPSGSYKVYKGERNESIQGRDVLENGQNIESLPTPTKSSRAVYVPLRRAGSHFLVRVGINGRAEGFFLLDTGASMTVLNPEIAREAGIPWDGTLPIMPLKTASGVIFPPIVHVDRFTLGRLSLAGGDVVVHDIRFGKGVAGLLGMNLLSDYRVALDTEKAPLILKPVLQAGPTYGGHSRKWWRRKFGFYRHTIRALETLRRASDRVLERYRISRERIDKSIEYYRDRLDHLKRLAEDELVPLEWRE